MVFKVSTKILYLCISSSIVEYMREWVFLKSSKSSFKVSGRDKLSLNWQSQAPEQQVPVGVGQHPASTPAITLAATVAATTKRLMISIANNPGNIKWPESGSEERRMQVEHERQNSNSNQQLRPQLRPTETNFKDRYTILAGREDFFPKNKIGRVKKTGEWHIIVIIVNVHCNVTL